MPERVGQALQRVAGVDDGPDAVHLDGADHRQLLLWLPTVIPLMRTLPIMMAAVGTSPAKPVNTPMSAICSAQPTRGDRLGERARAADLHDMIDAAPASELARGLSPVRVLAVVDDVIRAELAQALELGWRGRGRDDARARGFGELQREDRHAAGALDEHRVARLDLRRDEQRAPGGERGAGERRRLGVRSSRRAPE